MSTRTGPGRPVRAMWNASWIVRGISSGCWIMNECLTIGIVMPSDVGLLEAVGAEQLGAHLAGDEHDRDRVHHRVADRR